MQTLNILRQNYTLFSRPYQLKLPLEIGHVIPDNDCVRLLGQFVEELDLKDLYSTYSRVKENQVSPRQMLKIMLYAYHEHNYSSRGIEKACKRDINYMYLLEGRSAPDHATIARFRSIHFGHVADKYLAMMVNYLMDLGEISGKEIFIDGTKIEANANKYTFVWKKAVTKNQAKLLDKTALLVQECVETYGLREIWHGQVKEKHLGKILKKLYEVKEEEGIEFVHGSGCRKTQLQKHIELLEEYTARLKELFQDRSGCDLHAHEGGCNAQRSAEAGIQSSAWSRLRIYLLAHTVSKAYGHKHFNTISDQHGSIAQAQISCSCR